MNTAANQIVGLRKSLGLTQGSFAEKIGFSRSYINDIESGRANPSRRILKSIRIEFQVSTDWILFGGSMKERTKKFMDLIHKCLTADSQKTPVKKKKIYDHLQGINDLTEYEISFYIYNLLSLYEEREIKTKTLNINRSKNYIIETPGAYHAFLGTPVSEDQFAQNVIAYSIVSKHSLWHEIELPTYDQPSVECILEVKNNKFYYAPSDKFFEPHELFDNTRHTESWPGTTWPHQPHWQRKQSIEKYFSEINPTQTPTEEDVDLKLSDIEKSVINVFRAIDKNSLKDFYVLLASKGKRLAKKERDKIKKDIALLNKSSK